MSNLHRVPILCALVAALAACGGGSGTREAATATASTARASTAYSPDASAPAATADASIEFDSKQVEYTADESLVQQDSADLTPPETPPSARAFAAAAPARLADGSGALAESRKLPPVQIHVALDGNDGWTGGNITATGSDGPLRTLPMAQTRARQLLAQMNAGLAVRRAVQVVIGPGIWRLEQTLRFDAADSGTAEAPTVWRALKAGTVTLSGARHVGRVLVGAPGSVVSLSTVGLDPTVSQQGTQLFVDGRRATLARVPDAGQYWFVQRAVPLPGETAAERGRAAFAAAPGALALLRSLGAEDRVTAQVHMMQAWSSGRHRLANLNVGTDAVQLTPRAHWPYLHFGTDQRYYVENVAAAFDAPGEWIWNSQGLRYRVTAAEAGRSVDFEMPVLEQLVVVSGTAQQPVQDLRLESLAFQHTRLLTPLTGWNDGQAGQTLGAAIEVDHARRVAIESCSVSGTGAHAIWLRRNVQQSQVTGCVLSDLGAGGVYLGMTAQKPTTAELTTGNTVHANRIEHTGMRVPGGVGVLVAHASANVVSHNLVANTLYSAISVGWNWAYGESTARDNRILNNLLINIGQGHLSDMGAIYTLGESPGTVISGNLIHQVRGYPGYGAGAWGLYNDASSTGIVWERNIVIGTDDGGYLLHYGRNLTVRQNVLAFGTRSEVRVTRSDPLTRLAFDNNLLLPAHAVPFVSFATAPDVQYSGNRVSSRVLNSPADLTKCGTGCATSDAVLSMGADPRQVVIEGVDAATALWVANVAAAAGPPGLPSASVPAVTATLPPPVVAPPIGYVADFAGTAIGGLPINLRARMGNTPGAISVQAEPGTPSGKALRFADSASIQPSWEPYAWATLNHNVGLSEVRFSLRLDSGSDFLHEWRDDATTYLTGPALRIRPHGVFSGSRLLAPVRLGEWMHLHVRAALGTSAGTWSLQIRYANGETLTVADLPNKNADWQRLNWLGFVSNAITTSTAKVGSIEADNEAP